MPGNWGLIDLDTPKEAYYISSFRDGSQMQLVFSDEFNTDGRTFYPGTTNSSHIKSMLIYLYLC
jgi:beta-glucan synthesis-associated protein KRE6